MVPEYYLETEKDLRAYIDRLNSAEISHRQCAIDTEADSMHSYETKMCLIQFAVPGELAIVDTLSIGLDNLGVFNEYLESCDVVWMHGADYDMSMFRKTFEWVPAQVWDTQTAARLLGLRKYGLASLLDEEFAVEVSKQSQKADWSRRPLTEKMLAYAYNDVRYLLEMGARYLDRLKEEGRDDWFVESCDAARTSVMNRDERDADDFWRITGYGKLERKGLLFLRALWNWRDEECKKLDRPAFKFLSNQEILRMAGDLQADKRLDPPKYLRPGPVRRLFKAVEDAKKIPFSDYPEKRKKQRGMRLEINEGQFANLKAARDKVADELGIDPTLIATRTVLEKLSSQTMAEEEKNKLLLNWQRELMREHIS